jgi:hypothetical protein
MLACSMRSPLAEARWKTIGNADSTVSIQHWQASGTQCYFARATPPQNTATRPGALSYLASIHAMLSRTELS